MSRFSVPLRVAAVSATTLAVGMMAISPAVAAGTDAQVVNTETVQVYTDASGAVQTKRIYEQLALTGEGSAEVRNPIETKGLRNLDGFRGYSVEEGDQVAELTSDGKKRLRTVSDYTGDLPLDVQVRYTLDGEPVDPGDVVGKSGRLEVRYTVKNITGAQQEVTFDDGNGGTVTKTVEVPIPMVGSLTTVAPSNFTDVASNEANMAGDGKGGTKLSFTMTLFPPIGSDTAEFGYTANITDGVVPRASISALPVNPLESPSFKAAGASYKGGADTGAELAAGATEIDANLLKLRDGAGDLLAGLIQLRDGAVQLEAGLAGVAAPGADRLAGGASQLAGGLGQIDDGAGKLAAGSGKAADGGSRLAAGAGQLSGGLNQLDGGVGDLAAGAGAIADGQAGLAAGLTQLYKGVEMLPASVKQELKTNADYQALLGALQAIADGVGNREDAPTAGTLLGGVNAIQYAMRFPAPSAALDCYKALVGGTPEMCGALDGVDFVASQLDQGLEDLHAGLVGQATPGPLKGLYLVNGCTSGPVDGFMPPQFLPEGSECQLISYVYFGLFGPTADSAKTKITTASQGLTGITGKVDAQLLGTGAGLDRLRAGLSNGDPTKCAEAKATATKADDCGIKQAAQAVQAGVPVLVNELTNSISNQILAALGKPTKNCDPTKTLRCAAGALAHGGEDLVAGVNTLVAGVQQLNAGGMQLSAGAGELASGLGDLQDGAGQLAAGTGKAADGANQVADGANKLATGLGDAADGSGRLADGLGKAAEGAPKIRDGAQRLSDEGTSKLVEAGEATAQNYGEMYATIEAGAERAQTEKMVYGAPENAIGLAAYSYEIKGEDGAAGRNLTKGLGAMALLGAGAGAFVLRRRIV
jgi:putative membrane protein